MFIFNFISLPSIQYFPFCAKWPLSILIFNILDLFLKSLSLSLHPFS